MEEVLDSMRSTAVARRTVEVSSLYFLSLMVCSQFRDMIYCTNITLYIFAPGHTSLLLSIHGLMVTITAYGIRYEKGTTVPAEQYCSFSIYRSTTMNYCNKWQHELVFGDQQSSRIEIGFRNIKSPQFRVSKGTELISSRFLQFRSQISCHYL